MWLTIDGRSRARGHPPLAELLAEHRSARRRRRPVSTRRGQGALRGGTPPACSRSRRHERQQRSRALVTAPFDDSVAVVDTGSAAGGQALVVLAAAAAAPAGATLADVVARVAWVAGRGGSVATLPSLDHLVRSGGYRGSWDGRASDSGSIRCSNSAAATCAGCGRRSAVTPRSDRMVAHVQRNAPAAGRLHVAALHALAPTSATQLLDVLPHGAGRSGGVVHRASSVP